MKINSKIAFVVSCLISMLAFGGSAFFETVSREEGQRLLRSYFSEGEFCKGAWGNDVTHLLPFKWPALGKGEYVYFSIAEDKHFDGVSWRMGRADDGILHECAYEWSPDVDVWFDPSHSFVVTYYGSQSPSLCYHVELREIVPSSIKEEVASVKSLWWRLSVGTNGVPWRDEMPQGCANLFGDKNVKAILNVCPYRYRGKDVEVIMGLDAVQRRLSEVENEAACWRLKPADQRALANRHLRSILKHGTAESVINVYMVACDVNFDGVCDAYLTSDLEQSVNDTYKWTLYIGGQDEYCLQAKPLAFFFPLEVVNVKAEIEVPKNAFFRFDRVGMRPYAVALTEHNGRIETWDYLHNNSPVKTFRLQSGMENAEFTSCLSRDQKGVRRLDDLFVVPFAPLVRAERLPCEQITINLFKSKESIP